MAKNDDCHVTPELAECVREAGREILAMGHNPKFVRKRGKTMTDREVCTAMINEAKKIIASGHNARFSCSDKDLLKEATNAQRYRDRRKGVGGKHEI